MDIEQLRDLLERERDQVGTIRVPDGGEAAYLSGYFDALKYVIHVIIVASSMEMDLEDIRLSTRDNQIANSMLASRP